MDKKRTNHVDHGVRPFGDRLRNSTIREFDYVNNIVYSSNLYD